MMKEEVSAEMIGSWPDKELQAVKEELKKVPQEERQSYLSKVYGTEQLPGPPPFNYRKDYPEKSTFTYQTYKINYGFVQNTANPKAILILFHGMGSHLGNSGYFANTICESIRDINVYAFDQLNYGQSEGPFRGLIESLEDSARQGQTFVEFLLAKFENRPKIFLGGSSYGGSICMKMSLLSPDKYAGIILLAPAIKKGLNATGFLPGLARVLTCILPPVRLFKESDFNMATRYNNKEAMLADKLYYNDGIVPHSATAVINAMEEITKAFNKIIVPYIIFQGTSDKMVDLFGPLDLQQQSPSKDKTTIYFRGMWHNVYSEQEIVGVVRLTVKWLRERL